MARPKHQSDPGHDQNAAIDRPLRVTCHETTGQNVNSLEEENAASKDEHYSEDIEGNFHENFLCSRENVAMIILSEEPVLPAPSIAQHPSRRIPEECEDDGAESHSDCR